MNKEIIFAVDGMHCAACIEKVTKAMKGEAGVKVTLNPSRLMITGATELATLQQKIKKAGDRYGLRPRTAAEVRADSMPTASAMPAHDHAAMMAAAEDNRTFLQIYYPLFLIVFAIAVVSLKNVGDWRDWILNFEAGFFLVFGFFKLLNLKGFAEAYATYDLLAKKIPAYGFLYPFLELALGFAFLFHYQLTSAFYAAIILMGFSSLGVLQAILKKQKIRCACLGTTLNLPMTSITLIEDLAMVVMAAVMLTTGMM